MEFKEVYLIISRHRYYRSLSRHGYGRRIKKKKKKEKCFSFALSAFALEFEFEETERQREMTEERIKSMYTIYLEKHLTERWPHELAMACMMYAGKLIYCYYYSIGLYYHINPKRQLIPSTLNVLKF